MKQSKEFFDKLSTLPLSPGVYLMKNDKGKVIYVGKSKCLKNRVSSYFHSSGLNIKTQKLVSNIYDFDIIVTRTEREALVLENELIKRHNPKYNIKLKDAKTYPYIKLTIVNGFPAIQLSRRRNDKNAKYFGPFLSTYAVNDIIKTIQKTFRIPDCGKNFFFGKSICRPCLSYHLDNCLAPCTGKINCEIYTQAIKEIEYFLKGDCDAAVKSVEEKMLIAAENLRFEEAAKHRDTINNLKKLREKQAVISADKSEEDVFGFYQGESLSCITILMVRGGIISDKQCIFLAPDEICDDEAMSDMILRYYDNYDMIPRNIYMSFSLSPSVQKSLSDTLAELSEHNVNVHTPERGDKKALCNIAINNSKEAINTKLAMISNSEMLLYDVANLLNLEVIPQRIESYDISNSSNEFIYAGMIVLANGKFCKKDYRSFSIKTTDGQNDYGAMKEALTRRLLHIGKEDDESMNVLPDLILLDGGEGHVNVIKNVLQEMNMYIPVFGMVKDEHHKTRTLTDGEREISIALNKEMFSFFYRIQEEVHRYSFGKMDACRRKSMKTSSLTEINGIGQAKAKELLKHFGTLSAVKNASKEQLCSISGISEQIADNIINHFNINKE